MSDVTPCLNGPEFRALEAVEHGRIEQGAASYREEDWPIFVRLDSFGLVSVWPVRGSRYIVITGKGLALLADSRGEDARVYGVWCLDEACFYDPTPRDWNDAQTEAAHLCNTNTWHQFEARKLSPEEPTPA